VFIPDASDFSRFGDSPKQSGSKPSLLQAHFSSQEKAQSEISQVLVCTEQSQDKPVSRVGN
jgi:hypothetical protein